jgi:sulfatase modifying factor 1
MAKIFGPDFISLNNFPLKAAIFTFLVVVPFSEGAWDDIVFWEDDAGWQWVDHHWVYGAGNNWKWLQDAQVWIYVFDPLSPPPPDPAEMVFVQGGTVPGTSISSDSFYAGKYEVTWAEFQDVRTWGNARGYGIFAYASCSDLHAAETNWYNALKWCNAKSEKEGLAPVYTIGGVVWREGEPRDIKAVRLNSAASGYRLLSDVEWDFAARGGVSSQGYTFSGGNSISFVGWYADNSGGAECDQDDVGRGSWPVGLKKPNELGIYDMTGNVWEYVWDSSGNGYWVTKGGFWASYAEDMQLAVATIVGEARSGFGQGQGFRIARNASD